MMQWSPFYIATLPRIAFGKGSISSLPTYVREFGRHVLLVMGQRAFRASPSWAQLAADMEKAGIKVESYIVSGEPSPEIVDGAVTEFSGKGIDVVVGIGGGSVLDAAKAIAGLLPSGRSVLDHLEDVGRGIPYQGPSLPFIAVPTTAGTGSEATKNAVLSKHGEHGYKKSFRHESMVAKVALIDPQLMTQCPRELIAAQGMDAFTQLLESYVSLRANPFTDALAWSGLEAVAAGFWPAWEGGESEEADNGRAAMAYAALLSGITLAQVGLGSVHGLAQPLGSFFPIPHGVACGTTLAAATSINVQALRTRVPDSIALGKYARVGRLLRADDTLGDAQAVDALVHILEEWISRLDIPRLGKYGVLEADIPRIVVASRNNSMKSNPIVLSDEEVGAIVQARL